MKAYVVNGSDPDMGSDIVWADNATDAKKKAQCCECCRDDKWIDIRVIRIKDLDDMEDEVPYGGAAWNSDKIRTILVRDHGWACVDPWNKGSDDSCEECCTKQWCHWMDES